MASAPENSPHPAAPHLAVSPGPHLSDSRLTTRRMMLDVAIALVPAILVSCIVFRWYAALQIALSVASCVVFEALFTSMRRRPLSITDGSAAITGLILALSLPWSSPWYAAVIGSGVAIGLAKACFGGLGGNLFNPAMAGRAFIMLSFAKSLGAPAYIMEKSPEALATLTQATPLSTAKTLAQGALSGQWPEQLDLFRLILGNVNGSLGETSAIALLIGGIYLCARRAASWEIPAGVLLAAFVCSGGANWLGLTPLTALQHLAGGSLLFGAFFIATDPVTSPLAPRGKFLFGMGIGGLIILLRVFSSYPEGVMFAVLLMNAATVPRPLGGKPKPIEI